MERIRRSMLFIPGNTPGMLQSADVFDADSVIIDLEDSVSIDEKDAARILVKEVIETIQYENCEVIVRMNPYDSKEYLKDFEVLKDLSIHSILLPKASKESVQDLVQRLDVIDSHIEILLLIESALGVEHVFDLLSMSPRIVGLMLGGEDLCVDLNCERTKEGLELFYARSRVVNAAKALKKMVIDTPFTDTLDEEGLYNDSKLAKKLGFDGKASINPRQIEVINDVFSPTKDELIFAQRVIDAKDQALKEGKGVFSIDGKMVDLPIIKRAEKVVMMARKIGLLGDCND